MRRLLPLLGLLLLTPPLACGPEDGETGDPELEAACESLCAEQITCGATALREEECAPACLADIGTPGSACAQAIEALATCVQGSCDDEAACDAALVERDEQCGGQG